VDGDTVELDIDVGLRLTVRSQRGQLAGVDAPEMSGASRETGQVSSDWLRERIEGREVIVETIKDSAGEDEKEKYGRWLARLWIDGACVNDELVAEGLARVPAYL